MSSTRPDLRVSKTRAALTAAMLQLLEKNSFQKITVNDICVTAMVGRATFYTHFEDKYHLLRCTLDDLRGKIALESEDMPKDILIEQAVAMIEEHRSVFRNLFLGDGNQELMKLFSGLFVEHFTQILWKQESEGEKLPASVQVMAVFLAGGIAYLLLWWIGGEFALTREEMTKALISMAESRPVCEA